MRIGQGYDVHRLVEGRPLVLGGQLVPYSKGLDGHSDADVLLHALSDAILGAAGLGDIGSYFPPSDDKWKDADSKELLGTLMEEVRALGYRVVNCDMTLIAEEPKLGPYREAIQETVGKILGIAPSAVGVKATTNEQVGFVGRGEGMAALAVALLEEA